MLPSTNPTLFLDTVLTLEIGLEREADLEPVWRTSAIPVIVWGSKCEPNPKHCLKSQQSNIIHLPTGTGPQSDGYSILGIQGLQSSVDLRFRFFGSDLSKNI